LRALAIALSENSAPAGRLIGNQVIHPGSIDIGFAVEAEDGVLVPVIRSADKHTLKEMVPMYARLVELARQRRLTPKDMGQCISTVTNYGTFGLTLATPIPLPEQTVLLGLGAGRIEPKWDKDKEQFLPVTVARFTLSFDHRVLDGGAAGRLLMRISELLNNPEQL
jgi:pyruvate/2-oxoglutarate dehydrogenase complex dihydrolipoamide acyltransferase (E2) component